MGAVNVYDMPNGKIIEEFMQACAKASISNSGLCIDVMAGYELERAYYLKGVVLARMDKQTPPFKSGDVVKPKFERVPSADWWGTTQLADTHLKIKRVLYIGNGKWQLGFIGVEHSEKRDPRFPADSFCLVTAEALAPSS